MNFKFNNIFLNDVSIVVGPYEKEMDIPYDKAYKDFYFKTKSFDDAASKLVLDSVNILLRKTKLKYKDINIHLSSDLSNQLAASNYANINIPIPNIGIYSACASSALELIIASSMIQTKQIKNAICTVSSHNLSSEKQFRYPVEYGAPKRKTTTITATAASSVLVSSKKSKIKITSGTIGNVIDSGIKDVYNMGAVMAPAACDTLIKHLKFNKRDISYYDLVITGDLGCYGKEILKELLKENNIYLENYIDAGSMIGDLAGASGPVCLSLIAFGKILNEMKKKEYKKVLLIATGALHNVSMCNEKKSIPAIAHAISLEVVK